MIDAASKCVRSIAVLGSSERDARDAIDEAAKAVDASVHLYDDVDTAMQGDEPLAILTSARTSKGFETCARVRAEKSFGGIPIIVMSDQRNTLAFGDLFQSGGDDIIAHADARSLAARLRLLCSRPVPREFSLPGPRAHAVIAGASASWRRITARAFANAGIPTRFVDGITSAMAESHDAKVVIACDDVVTSEWYEALAAARREGSITPWIFVAPPKRTADIIATVASITRVAVVDAFAPPENVLFVANDLVKATLSDNRGALRSLYGTTVSFCVAGREASDVGFTYNVSASGIYVRTLAPPSTGESVWIDLAAPRSARHVRLVGTVAWRRQFGPNDQATVPAGFGVRIDEGLLDDLERWREGCNRLAQEEARPRPSGALPISPVVVGLQSSDV